MTATQKAERYQRIYHQLKDPLVDKPDALAGMAIITSMKSMPNGWRRCLP